MIHETVKRYSLPKEQLEQMLNEIVGDADMDELMGLTPPQANPRNLSVGEIVEGSVLSISQNNIVVDFGGKAEGYLPYVEASGFSNDDVDIGDTGKFLISRISRGGTVTLARKDVEQISQQREVMAELQTGECYEGRLVKQTRNGWLVDLKGLPANLPSAQEYLPYPPEGPTELVGTNIPVIIESIAPDSITLTRKPFASEIRKQAKNDFFSALKPGLIVEGRVKNLGEKNNEKFGAFVQLTSGVVGLCHSSDFGEEEPKVGEDIKCRVLRVDKDKNRIFLGIRQVNEPTWEELVSNYPVNSRVTGRVKSIKNYGAFIEIEPRINGLIHVSDLSWSEHVKHPREILKENETVEVVILGIDEEKQHLALGLKQLSSDPWDTVLDRYLVGSRIKGMVTNKTKFGVFIKLEPGVDGLAHHTIKSKDLEVGEEAEVTILRIDPARKRVSLALEE